VYGNSVLDAIIKIFLQTAFVDYFTLPFYHHSIEERKEESLFTTSMKSSSKTLCNQLQGFCFGTMDFLIHMLSWSKK